MHRSAKGHWWPFVSGSSRRIWIDGSPSERLRLPVKVKHLGREPYVQHWTAAHCGELVASKIPTIFWDTRGNQVLRVVAEGQGRELAEVAQEAGAEMVSATSLKAALFLYWD